MLKPAFRELSAQACQLCPEWQQLPHGEWLKQQVEQALEPIWPRLFGYHLASYGSLASQLARPGCHIRHGVMVSPDMAHPVSAAVNTQHSGGAVKALGIQWPFAEHSLDAVVTALTIEYEADPHRLLRELTLSLRPDGYLILVGCNPFAPALLTGWWPRMQQRYPWPWCGRYFSRARVLDWLALLNFEVVLQPYVGASLLHPDWQPQPRWLGRLQQRLPGLGSLYVIVARKRELRLTPLRVKKREQKVAGLNLANQKNIAQQ